MSNSIITVVPSIFLHRFMPWNISSHAHVNMLPNAMSSVRLYIVPFGIVSSSMVLTRLVISGRFGFCAMMYGCFIV